MVIVVFGMLLEVFGELCLVVGGFDGCVDVVL